MMSSNDVFLNEIEEELHDLCQPLTALHFRLELGKSAGDQEALREAVDGALEEMSRMMEAIKRMRDRVSTLKAGE
jgi:signal transduction histidine kinase